VQDAVPFTYSANGNPVSVPGFGISAFSLSRLSLLDGQNFPSV